MYLNQIGKFFGITALFLGGTSSWAKDIPKPIWFSVAQDHEEVNGTRSFAFELNEWECRIESKGNGRCISGRSVWKFKLPTVDGAISNIFFNTDAGNNLIYSVDNGEEVWAIAAKISPRRATPVRTTQLPGLNFTIPFLFGNKIVIISSLSVGSISAGAGDWLWRHQWLHDEGGGGSPKVNVNSDILKFEIIGTDSKVIGNPICFNLEFGSIVNCQ